MSKQVGVLSDISSGADVPEGCVPCEGQSFLRSEYPDLFDKIGTAYGAADETHFNMPDMRIDGVSRMIIAVGKKRDGVMSELTKEAQAEYEHWLKRKPHRQICALCHEVSRVDFDVSNEVWEFAVQKYWQNSIICLQCFTRLADERGVEWDKDIKFYPRSWISQQKVGGEHRR